jgi:hypothetical protein
VRSKKYWIGKLFTNFGFSVSMMCSVRPSSIHCSPCFTCTTTMGSLLENVSMLSRLWHSSDISTSAVGSDGGACMLDSAGHLVVTYYLS